MQIDLETIRRIAASEKGVVALARESGLPYTTLRSMAERDWTHKSVERLAKLSEAAQRLAANEAANDAQPQGAAA